MNQSTTRADFSKAMALLAVSLGFELDEPTIGVYWHALRMVPADLRREAFAQAVSDGDRGRKWYRLPQPNELKQIAAQIQRERRAAVAKLHLADCTHSGHYLEVECADGVIRAHRCPCFKAAQDAMAQLGQALALPERISDEQF